MKHHRENQDRWSEEDFLRVGIGMSLGAAPACWQRTFVVVEAKNIDFAASIPMRSRRAVATMRRWVKEDLDSVKMQIKMSALGGS